MTVNFMHKSCLGKKPYKTLKAANRRIQEKTQEGIFLRAYYCQICLKFHVTKQGAEVPKEKPPVQPGEPIKGSGLPKIKLTGRVVKPVLQPRPDYRKEKDT